MNKIDAAHEAALKRIALHCETQYCDMSIPRVPPPLGPAVVATRLDGDGHVIAVIDSVKAITVLREEQMLHEPDEREAHQLAVEHFYFNYECAYYDGCPIYIDSIIFEETP